MATFFFLGQLFGGQLFEFFARETNLKKQSSVRNLRFVQHCAVRKLESDCFQHILSSRADVEQKVNVKERAWKIWKKREKTALRKIRVSRTNDSTNAEFPHYS